MNSNIVEDPKTKSVDGGAQTPARVCAVVVTFNRKTLLEECLRALHSQTRPLDTVLVVDNASTDGTHEMVCDLAEQHANLEVLRLPDNVGGAGGFHAGMKWACEAGFDWLWIMDDDGVPAPDCLQVLLDAHEETLARKPDTAPEVLVPLQRDSSGHEYGFSIWRGLQINVTREVTRGHQPPGTPVFHFVGPLIARSLVEWVGLPRADFFIWFDDIEWALRAAQGGGRVRFVPGAVFHHDFGGTKTTSFLGRPSVRMQQPVWKEYYGARNTLYTLTRTPRRGELGRELVSYFLRTQGRGMIGDLMYEPDRWARIKMRMHGISDGARGRMGARVSPGGGPR